MKSWHQPTTSVLLDARRVEMARQLSTAVKPKPSTSRGVRYALTQVHRDPRSALEWVIRRYGDPMPSQEHERPVYWLPAMHVFRGESNGTVTISGLDAKLKAVAHAFGYGTSSRGISYAIDYAMLRQGMPEPQYLGGAGNAPPAYTLWTLDQHVEYFNKQVDINMRRLERSGTVRQEMQREMRLAKLGMGPLQPDTSWLDGAAEQAQAPATSGDDNAEV